MIIRIDRNSKEDEDVGSSVDESIYMLEKYHYVICLFLF